MSYASFLVVAVIITPRACSLVTCTCNINIHFLSQDYPIPDPENERGLKRPDMDSDSSFVEAYNKFFDDQEEEEKNGPK